MSISRTDPFTYGWVWVPGVEWAPCWVDWRVGGGYIGWVPCAPPGFVIAPSFCVFVQDRHFHDRIRPDVVIVNNRTIIKKTTEIRNVRHENREFDGRSRTVVVNEGPRVNMVEKATGHKFTSVPVREVDRRTTVLVPEQFKHRTDEPGQNDRPHAIQEQSKPSPGWNSRMPDNNPSKKEMPAEKVVPPERTFPQTPPDKTIPQAPRERIIPQTPPDKTIPQTSHERIIPQTPPDKTIPQTPPERIIPPGSKDLPADKELHPKRVGPPFQSPPPVSPVMPSGNPGGNEKGDRGDKDKDHGHDNP